MRQAKQVGLLRPGFAFISYELLIDKCASPNKTEEEDCDLLEGMLDISLFVPQNEAYQKFANLVRKKMAEEPFNRVMEPSEPVCFQNTFHSWPFFHWVTIQLSTLIP